MYPYFHYLMTLVTINHTFNLMCTVILKTDESYKPPRKMSRTKQVDSLAFHPSN